MSKMSKAIAVLGVVAGLGVAALPLSSYAVETATTNVKAQAIVGDSIAISSSADTITMNDVKANQEINKSSATITVQTNNATGYSVSIKDTDSDTALKPTDGGTAEGIPAKVPVKGSNGWGYMVSSVSEGLTNDATDYAAVKSGPAPIVSKNSASAAAGDTFELTFGVTVDTTIAAGTYEDQVTLTATTNN